MESLSRHLLEVLDTVLPALREIPEDAAALGAAPGKWSKKQILGHLIDSAGNNQQKFVRGIMADPHVDMPAYAHNAWVEVQQYQTESWAPLIALWEAYHRHLAHVIHWVPAEALAHTVSISGSQPFTLRFIMEDYVEHLKHHLKQILPDAGLESAFVNLY